MKNFINYAHRGASEYAPENTLLSFYTGLFMQANGIETDVQLTKDGVPVLFHDDTVDRVTDGKGKVCDFTLKELQSLWVLKNGHKDKIITFENFLSNFAHFDLTFAIELKGGDTAKPTADLIRKFGIENKVIATSFKYKELLDMRAYAPEIKTGYLVYNREIDDQLLDEMKADGLYELCPEAPLITAEKCKEWHKKGFSVRAWGVANTDLMQKVYFAGADGMTVNFPDKLTELIKNNAR